MLIWIILTRIEKYLKFMLEINSLQGVKQVEYEKGHYFVLDDFYIWPNQILGILDQSKPSLWKAWEKPSFNGIHFFDQRHKLYHPEMNQVITVLERFLQSKSKYIDSNILTNLIQFKSSEFNDYENNFWWPHIDHCKFTAIIYLNYDQDSGTNLYQQIKADPKGEIEHFMPWRPKIRYKLLTTINSGFNRLAIFPGNQLHGMSINNSNYFNSNWRLNQVIFFD